jgi:hypothetical protein
LNKNVNLKITELLTSINLFLKNLFFQLEQILVDNGKFEKQKANKATAEPKLNVEQAIGKLKTAIHQWVNYLLN